MSENKSKRRRGPWANPVDTRGFEFQYFTGQVFLIGYRRTKGMPYILEQIDQLAKGTDEKLNHPFRSVRDFYVVMEILGHHVYSRFLAPWHVQHEMDATGQELGKVLARLARA